MDRHWCDGKIFETVLKLLVDVLDSQEQMVEICIGFVSPISIAAVANATLDFNAEGLVNFLKGFFDPAYIDFMEDDEENLDANTLSRRRSAMENNIVNG